MTSEKEFIKQLIEEQEKKKEERIWGGIIAWTFVSLVLFFHAALILVLMFVWDKEILSFYGIAYCIMFFSYLYFISVIVSMIIRDVKKVKDAK